MKKWDGGHLITAKFYMFCTPFFKTDVYETRSPYIRINAEFTVKIQTVHITISVSANNKNLHRVMN
jgi:hypothetical protein